MTNNAIVYQPIGVVHSPFDSREGMPIQPLGARGVAGSIELEPAYCEGLQDLEGFSHIILLYHLHRSEGYRLRVKPFLEQVVRGLFATRAPRRPNPIGLSVVKLTRVEGNVLHIVNVDILDGTPLLDIKPYVPAFDGVEELRIGWLEERVARAAHQKADRRFTREM